MHNKKSKIGQIADVDIKLLKVFKSVAECGSFTAAETLLGITRSAISLHMGDLEKRLGIRLCYRGRAGFSLTEEGLIVLRDSETLLAAVENFRQQMNQIHDHLRGEFNIGIINNLVTQPEMKITNALSFLRGKGDEVVINISMTTQDEIERKVMDGRLHVGVIPLNSVLSSLNYQSIYSEQSFLYCGKGHPLFNYPREIREDEIKNLDAVMPNGRIDADALEIYNIMKPAARASDREGIAFLILTGKFVGFLPSHYANIWVDKGELKCINQQSYALSNDIAVITRKGDNKNLLLDCFMGHLF